MLVVNLLTIRQKGESQNGGNKTKRQIFLKTNIFLPADTHTYQEIFRKIWRTLFSRNTRVDIRPCALLPTNCLVLFL